MAVRVEDWKLVFAEQRENGMRVWAEPLVKLRMPRIFNLRRDPFEEKPGQRGAVVVGLSAVSDPAHSLAIGADLTAGGRSHHRLLLTC